MQPHDPRPHRPHQPPPGHYPPYPIAHQQPHIHGQVQRTVTTAGLPAWMHVCYALLGWIPCFLGWAIWPLHWWFAKSKASSSTTVVQPLPPPYPPYRPPGYGPPHV